MTGFLLAALLVPLAAEAPPQEYLVAGVVVWSHPASSSIAIRGANFLGRMRVEVRTYRVKQPSALVDLHPGDKVTAVFSTKDGLLHRLRRLPARSTRAE